MSGAQMQSKTIRGFALMTKLLRLAVLGLLLFSVQPVVG